MNRPPPNSPLFPSTPLFRSASSAAAQSSGTKPLQFDLTAIPATRDSFVFDFRGAERGWAPRKSNTNEIRPLEMTQERSEEHTSELQSLAYLVCRLLLEKKKK